VKPHTPRKIPNSSHASYVLSRYSGPWISLESDSSLHIRVCQSTKSIAELARKKCYRGPPRPRLQGTGPRWISCKIHVWHRAMKPINLIKKVMFGKWDTGIWIPKGCRQVWESSAAMVIQVCCTRPYAPEHCITIEWLLSSCTIIPSYLAIYILHIVRIPYFSGNFVPGHLVGS